MYSSWRMTHLFNNREFSKREDMLPCETTLYRFCCIWPYQVSQKSFFCLSHLPLWFILANLSSPQPDLWFCVSGWNFFTVGLSLVYYAEQEVNVCFMNSDWRLLLLMIYLLLANQLSFFHWIFLSWSRLSQKCNSFLICCTDGLLLTVKWFCFQANDFQSSALAETFNIYVSFMFSF